MEHEAVATVLIIGASRGIGLETVKAALEAGHSVRALARSARRIPIGSPKLEKMAGDALETATVKRALSGVGAVIQSLGVSAGPEVILKPTRFFSKATRVLVTAMEETDVKRLICGRTSPSRAGQRAWRRPRSRSAAAARCPCRRRCWSRSTCACRRRLLRAQPPADSQSPPRGGICSALWLPGRVGEGLLKSSFL